MATSAPSYDQALVNLYVGPGNWYLSEREVEYLLTH